MGGTGSGLAKYMFFLFSFSFLSSDILNTFLEAFLFFHSSFLCLWNDFLSLWLFSSSGSVSSTVSLNSSGTKPISQHFLYQSNTFFLFFSSASGCTYFNLNSSVTNLALNLYHSNCNSSFFVEIVSCTI